MRPSISVIIPLFNKSPYIEATLSAFLKQLHAGEEIIVVDDCSTDSGPDIAERMLTGAHGCYLVKMPKNVGPGSARNAGAKLAKGSHLLFFDADDIPSSTLLNELRAAIERFPEDHIFTYKIAFQARGENFTKPTVSETERRRRHAFISDSIQGRTLCTASSTCVTRFAFGGAEGFQEGLRYCEDPELWSRLSAQFDVIVINNVLAIYQDVPQSLSYGWRGHLGSANPYIDTLLKLSLTYGHQYKSLARTMIFRNIFFAKSAGTLRSDISEQLQKYRKELGRFNYFLLKVFNITPSFFLGTIEKWRTTLNKSRIKRLLNKLN